MQVSEKNRSFTQLIEFHIEPRQQVALVAALSTQSERLAQGHGGFINASVQVSDDGRRVLNYLQWHRARTARRRSSVLSTARKTSGR